MSQRDDELSAFWYEFEQMWAVEEQQRKGQLLFNLLYSRRPDLANEIVASELDPFYNDAVYQFATEFINTRW